MTEPKITSIQRYSIHDGKGIRTTVFFKGCPLRCAWCHNPETQKYIPELLFYEERCKDCKACADECETGNAPNNNRSACKACGDCIDACAYDAREICGKTYSIDELMNELLKDRAFYENSGGGVTLSGGEVLSQEPGYIEELVKRLHRSGISVNIDTCGAVSYSAFSRFLPYVDTFLYDIKLLDDDRHILLTGKSNKIILDNLKKLSNEDKKIWIRIPVIDGVNATTEDIRAIAMFLKEANIKYQQINLLPYHDTGSGKYAHLGIDYDDINYKTPSVDCLNELKRSLEVLGAGLVEIGG